MDKMQLFSWSHRSLSSVSSPFPFFQARLLEAIILAMVLLLTISYLHRFGTETERGRRPPGPRPYPIVGNFALLGDYAHRDFQKLAGQYGPIFRLFLGSKETIVVSSPKIAEEILKTHDIAFASRSKLSQFTVMGYNSQTVITAPYGPLWRHTKKLLTHELLTIKRNEQFKSIRKEEVLAALHSLLEQCKGGKAVPVIDQLTQIAMNNVTRMMMNKSFLGPNSNTDPSAAKEIVHNVKEVFRLNGSFIIGDYIPFLKPFSDPLQTSLQQMRVAAQKNDEFFQSVIDDHRQKLLASEQTNMPEAMDFVDSLLTRPTATKEEPQMTDTVIKGIIMDMLIGATDTTSRSLEWALAELLRHPEVMKRAHDELDGVVGQDRLVDEEDLPNLKYLRCIVNEVMRLHPAGPLMLPHECRESREVAGYHIPAKSQVFVNVFAIARDPEVWERAPEFHPDRFESTAIDLHGRDFELLPFGSGRRICPGKNLALLTLVYVLAVFLQACDWALPVGVRPEDVDLTEVPGSAINCLQKPIEALASPRLPMEVIFPNITSSYSSCPPCAGRSAGVTNMSY